MSVLVGMDNIPDRINDMRKDVYDYIIIGAGPSGLVCAQMLSKLNKKVLVIERDETIGGCHRVKRINGDFTQHSPMVYTNSALNFINILNEINYDFYTNFTKYNFSLFTIFNDRLKNVLTLKELFTFVPDFLYFSYDNKYLLNISVFDYLTKHNFSENAIDIIDKICRLSDGADAKRYSMNSFFQLLNQNIFYTLYQPRKANDKGMMKRWEEFLLERNVDIITNTEITELDHKNKILDKKYKYEKLILCIPPKNISSLTGEKLQKDISYNTYVSVTFHYNAHFSLEKHHGFSTTPWGIFWIVMSDYLETENGILISATASVLDKKSDATFKTVNETTNETDLKLEIFRQLNQNFNDMLPVPDKMILNPNISYSKTRGWECKDSAFLDVVDPVYLDYVSNLQDVYYVGAHNGMTFYQPTSIEKAVTNSMNVMLGLEPGLNKFYKVRKGFYLDLLIKIILLVVVVVLFVITVRYLRS